MTKSISPKLSIVVLLVGILLLSVFAPVRANGVQKMPESIEAAPVHTFEIGVNTDHPDKNPGDGICASTFYNYCTLRAAIEEANASTGEDRIQFHFCAYATKVLTPESPYPAITEAVTIDGDSSDLPYCIQSSITLDGSLAGAGAHGLHLQGNNITVQALNIYNFQGSGVYIEGDYNLLDGLYIGTDRSGTAGIGNWANGVTIHSGRQNAVSNSNLSGNLLSGILIEGGEDNKVQSNRIGLWSPTNTALPNQINGVRVSGGSGHVIGGVSSSEGNTISGNGQAGVYLGANASHVTIAQNNIGLSKDGQTANGNGTAGIEIRGASNQIGTENSNGTISPNTISGNRTGILLTGSGALLNDITGNRIGLDTSGDHPLGNTNDGVLIQNGAASNRLRSNRIGSNGRHGVYIVGTSTTPSCDMNIISGNTIGKISDENVDLGNGSDGIFIKGSSCNRVYYNTTSYNGDFGIYLDGTKAITATIEQNTSTYNEYSGILIGSDNNVVEQNTVAYNGNVGLVVSGSHNHIAYTNAFGGFLPNDQPTGILVGGNDNAITGFGKSDKGVSQNSLAGIVLNGNDNRVYNYSIVGNFGMGVQVFGHRNTIGSESQANYVDGNVWGIVIEANAMNTQVINNSIGNDRSGGNPSGNGITGIVVRGRYSVIGGSVARRNIIANTQEVGLLLTDGAHDNEISYNYVGVKSDLSAAPNQQEGIKITGSSNDNLIRGNRIANNFFAGVLVESGAGNQVINNMIHANGGLGIDLSPSGVTANDSGDGDSGPNNLQNYPVISMVSVDSSNTRIIGALDGSPNLAYRIELFINDTCDNSGFGEGQNYTNVITLTANASGQVDLNLSLAGTALLGKYLTVTATDPLGNTSEFSRCTLGRPAGGTAPFIVNMTGDTDDTNTGDGICDSNAAAGEQCSLRAAVQQANANTGANTIIVPSGTYALTQAGTDNAALSGDLDITDSTGGLTIVGSGANVTLIQNSVTDRLFDIRGTSPVTITGVMLTGGNHTASGGGAILVNVNTSLMLDTVNVQNNQSSLSGGAIYNQGTITIASSAIVSNTATSAGGGIYQSGAAASLTLINTTVSNNQSAANGGGISNQSGAVQMKNVTVAYNTASGDGGGLHHMSGTFSLQNSIVAQNDDTTHSPYQNGTADCSGAFTSGGYNLIGDYAHAYNYPTTPDGCTLTGGTGDSMGGTWFGTNYLTFAAGLGALQFNGGTSLSRSPVSSAAGLSVDWGSPSTPGSGGGACEAFDQRNQPRPIDGGTDGIARCDRGAVEHIPSRLSINDVNVAEGGSASFTVSLSEPALITFTVSYSSTNISAVSGTDYTFTSGTLTFPLGATSQTVAVPTLNDTYNEASETFRVRLFSPRWVFISDGEGIATIQDGDPMPAILVNDASASEGGQVTFAVTLNSPSGQTVTVDYAASGVTATDDEDFTTLNGTLAFTPGVTSLNITITTLEDELQETNETFTFALSNPVNTSLGDASGVGTIADDDTPAFSVADQSREENADGVTPVTMVFNVTLSKISAQATTVAYTTIPGTATAGSDYTSASGVLTFAPGQLVQTISVTIVSDGTDEPDETFSVVLNNPTGGAALNRSTAIGTIGLVIPGYKVYLPLMIR